MIERLVRSLQTRGYLVWFDVDMMKGSTVDAMSDAIDNADAMLYAVSEQVNTAACQRLVSLGCVAHTDGVVVFQYKESGNCRLEANYAHQQDVDMIPLLVEKGYRPKGWLGLIMGETVLHTRCRCVAWFDTQSHLSSRHAHVL